MCSNTKKLLVYPIWHPGKADFGLIAKEDVFLCSTYYKGMDMHGYRAHIMEYSIVPVLRIAEATKTGYVEIHPGECFDAQNIGSETRRGRKMTEKSNCLMAKENTDLMRYDGPRIIDLFGKKVRVLGIRRFTPTECARLQTIPTWYKWECSDSQAYRMLGNGWTIEVIKHFFKFLPWATTK